MNRLTKPSLMLLICALTLAVAATSKAQAADTDVKTFFNSEITGLTIQVNATAEAVPNENITVILALTAKSDVTFINMTYLSLGIHGFLNGTEKTVMGNITDGNFSLVASSSKIYNESFVVPQYVWDVTYGEINLTYSATYGPVLVNSGQLTIGFTMTHVKNVYVQDLETQLQNLNKTYGQLSDAYHNLANAFDQLNQSYLQLEKNYTSLRDSANDLDSTRRIAVVLGITTAFFVATTVYVVMRRPREHW